MVAARSKDVAFIVLMAGTGVPGAEILEEQGQLILKASGSSESELKTERDIQKRLIDIIVHEKDEKVAQAKLAAALKEIRRRIAGIGAESASPTTRRRSPRRRQRVQQRLVPFLPQPMTRARPCAPSAARSWRSTAKRTCRSRPRKTSRRSTKALKAGGNRDVKTVELPGLNHLFQPCKTGTPSEYASIETTIAPEALKTMGDWIAAADGCEIATDL